MSEVLDKQIEELTERLEKATKCYKEVKAELDAKNKLLVEMDAATDTAELNARIKELEDEIAINGNASEEIAKLNERLDKAKQIFAEQKATIKDLKAANETLTTNFNESRTEYAAKCGELEAMKDTLNNLKKNVTTQLTELINSL